MSSPLDIPQQLSEPKKCSFCNRDLLNNFFIQCAVCDKTVFCADCFSAGVQVNDHVNTHSYRVPACLETAIFENAWSAKEELLLLNGIEKFGVGNWKIIADFMNTGKTTKQVEDHYWLNFMGSHGYCLPPQFLDENKNIVAVADLFPESNEDDLSSNDLYRIPVIEGYSRGDPVIRDMGVPNSTKAKDRNEINAKIAQMHGSEIPGYMPLRQDFECEFDNDAEAPLADMEFSPEDHPSEIALKLDVVRIYNQKVEERAKRRNFVIERDLIDVKGQQTKEKKLSKEEREMVAKLRVFARFHTKEEHEALVDGILKAHRLRNQITLYKVYEEMGLKTLEQVRKFESDRKNYVKNNGRKMNSMPAINFGGSYGNGTASGIASLLVSNGSVDDNDGLGGDRPRKRGRPPKNSNGIDEEPLDKKPTYVPKSKSTRSSSGGILAPEETGVDFEETLKFIRKAPGGDLLAGIELELCARLPLFPYHYLALKDVLVREAYRNGMLTIDGVRRLVKVDEEKCGQIYDFFVRELKVNEPPKYVPAPKSTATASGSQK